MSAVETLRDVVEQVAEIAGSIKRRLFYFVALGAIATAYLAWSLYSADSSVWWNLVKLAVVSIPALVWLFVWSVLAQLQQAPVLVSQLIEDDDGLFANLHTVSRRQPKGLSGVFSTLREFKQEDGLEVVFETLGGVSLLANPLFVIFSFANMAILFTLILVACALLVF